MGLLWALTGSIRRIGPLRRYVAARPHVWLRSVRQVDRWFAQVTGAGRAEGKA